MRAIFALALIFSSSAALAQQPSPSSMALAINQAVGQLAQQLEAEKARAEQLQQQVVTLQKQLSEKQAEPKK